MYDNGLQDPELQMYHKEIKFSINLFLQDILEGTFSEYFHTVTDNGYVHIYFFFCLLLGYVFCKAICKKIVRRK